MNNWLDRENSYFIAKNLPIEHTGWNHPVFNQFRDKVEEENRFIENPIVDIAEGIIECQKCKSKKTFSYQKQVRSSDEGFTLFVSCVNCNESWVETS